MIENLGRTLRSRAVSAAIFVVILGTLLSVTRAPWPSIPSIDLSTVSREMVCSLSPVYTAVNSYEWGLLEYVCDSEGALSVHGEGYSLQVRKYQSASHVPQRLGFEAIRTPEGCRVIGTKVFGDQVYEIDVIDETSVNCTYESKTYNGPFTMSIETDTATLTISGKES